MTHQPSRHTFSSDADTATVTLLPQLPNTRVLLGLWAGAMLLMSAAAVMAQDLPVRSAVDEAASVQSIATAARLCNLISEGDLNRATSRMARVHAAQMAPADQETYLIVRGSESFRNTVFASALKRAQTGCNGELSAMWRDVDSTLVAADLRTGSTVAANSAESVAR